MTALDLQASARFGRRRGWALHHAWDVARRLGVFRSLKAIDWSRVRRFVFVCRGNICRSAYAEQRARAMNLPALSFGLQARAGREADATAIQVARAREIDLGSHRARSLSEFFPQSGDLLVAMEPGQLFPLVSIARSQRAQVTLLGLWCSPARPYLQDPYGLNVNYFRTCFGFIDDAIENMGRRMRAQDGWSCV